MSKKIKIEIEQKDIDTLVNEHIKSFLDSPYLTQKIQDAINTKLDNFAFQQRIIFDSRLQADIEKMVKKILVPESNVGINKEWHDSVFSQCDSQQYSVNVSDEQVAKLERAYRELYVEVYGSPTE